MEALIAKLLLLLADAEAYEVLIVALINVLAVAYLHVKYLKPTIDRHDQIEKKIEKQNKTLIEIKIKLEDIDTLSHTMNGSIGRVERGSEYVKMELAKVSGIVSSLSISNRSLK